MDRILCRIRLFNSQGQTNDANTKKPKSASELVVSNPKIDRDRVIIEDWNSEDEEEVNEVQTVRPETQTVKTRDDKSGQNSQKQGIGFRKVKACFVCKSTDHLIKDCNFHDKRSQESNLKNVVNTGKREGKPVWDNTKRVNHQNLSKYPHLSKIFVPSGVLTRTGFVSTARSSISTARPVCTARPSINTARPVSTASPSISIARPVYASRPIYPRMDNVRPRGSCSPIKRSYYTKPAFRPKDLKQDVKTFGVKNMTTAGKRAVVNTGKGKLDTDLKKSRWVWRPKGNYLDHVSKDSGSFMLKKGNPEILLQDHAVVDSGCSSHMTGNKAYLSDYEDYNGGFVAFGSDPKGGKITGKGKIKTANLDFDDVYFVDELKFNLFSVSQMCDKKNSVLFTESECLILSPSFKLLDESQVVLRAPRKDDVYSLDLKNIVPSGGITCLYANATADESKLWHRRLGHVNFKNINKLVKGHLVRGLPLKVFVNDHTCVACKKGKQHKASCKAKLERIIRNPLELLHMDLFGPVSVESINKKRYCLVVTDDFSRFSWVFFLATKDETSEILCNLIIGLENQLNHNVKIIRCDNGTEFKNHAMNEFCAKKGIKREFSVARTLQQNGVAERKNRTLIEAARTMLADSLLPIPFWAEAVNTACYVLNRDSSGKKCKDSTQRSTYVSLQPHRTRIPVKDVASAVHEKPSEISPKDNDVQDLEDAVDKKEQHQMKEREQDLQDELEKMVTQELTAKAMDDVSRQAFEEEKRRIASQKKATQVTSTNILSTDRPSISTDRPLVSTDRPSISIDSTPTGTNASESSFVYLGGKIPIDASTLPNSYSTLRHYKDHPKGTNSRRSYISSSNKRKIQKLLLTTSLEEPKTISQALQDESWVEAMQEELLQFKLQKVWVLMDLPYGKKVIGTKWVFRNKRDERNIVVKNKAWFVAQGFRHEEGIDYDEVLHLLPELRQLGYFLAFASYMGFTVYQMDVKSAFLYGTIEEEVYVHQPPGFVDPAHPNKVYKVIKALYGLHQAPRAWYETLSSFLIEVVLKRYHRHKHCLSRREKSDIMLVQVYVDDIIFGSTKKSMCTEFEDLKQQPDGIFISQDKYVADILKKFYFLSIRTATTPIESNNHSSRMRWCRCRVHVIQDFKVTPKASTLMLCVNRIFRYLKHQPKLGLWYPRDLPFELEALHADSDYGGANLKQKTTRVASQFLDLLSISFFPLESNYVNKETLMYPVTLLRIRIAPPSHSPVTHIQVLDFMVKRVQDLVSRGSLEGLGQEAKERSQTTYHTSQSLDEECCTKDKIGKEYFWKRISEKMTKNEAKNDKIEHEMERRGKAKSKSKSIKVKVNPDTVNSQRETPKVLMQAWDKFLEIKHACKEKQHQSEEVQEDLPEDPGAARYSELDTHQVYESIVNLQERQLNQATQILVDGWILVAAVYHLPSFQSMGVDMRMNLSLFITIYISSIFVLLVFHLIFLGLWYIGLVSRVAGRRPEILTILQNCAVLSVACCVFYSHCGNHALNEKRLVRRDSGLFTLWKKGEPSIWLKKFLKMYELKDEICKSWFAPVGSAGDYPLLSKWVLYGEFSSSGPCESSDEISPIYSLWATFIGLYMANYVVERSTGWALTHPLSVEKTEKLKNKQMKPNFLDMVPWYSGTSADLFKTVFDLLVFVTVFVGRFDMRMMQAEMSKVHEWAKKDFLYDHLSEKEHLLFNFMADTGDGGNSSYSVVRLLAQPTLHAINDDSIQSLPRADLLLIGGDLA
ncbi:putative ribonuclease H-like domain-containing protein [Tanacetum coccineum]|uniref:Ribonuclease H-like domain-containing protein n=1 Tax=Tanacetum coccineum TaxID=301880 RepID=A0ABQ5D128_9ASTR